MDEFSQSSDSMEIQLSDSQEHDLPQLGFAAIYGFQTELLEKLLESGLDPNSINKRGESLLHVAIKTLNPDMVDVLLNYGADANMISPLEQKAHISNLKYLFNNNDIMLKNATPLITALNVKIIPALKNEVLQNMNEIVESLLNHGAKVNKQEEALGLTPLHFAASKCDPVAIKNLMASGADVNAKAFQTEGYDYENPLNILVTPLLLSAISTMNREQVPECIDLFARDGANIDEYSHLSFLYALTLSELNESNPDKARDILLKKVNSDFEKMRPDRIQKIVDKFLAQDSQYASQYEGCVRSLLDKNINFSNKMDQIRYFSHLNSWEGVVSGNFKPANSQNSDKSHYIEEVEGWYAAKQIPGKIVNLLHIMKGIDSPNFNCRAKFKMSKKETRQKLMDEICQQTITYFTYQHLNYGLFLRVPLMQDLKVENSLSCPKWYFQPKVSLKRAFETALVEKWSERIGNLRPGQYFSMYFGTQGHAAYATYRMNENGTLTRNNYNLGAGLEMHPVSLDGKIFPYSITDIPAEPFRKKNRKALEHLYSFITALGNPPYERKNEVHQAFSNAYESAFAVGGQLPTSIKGLIPMKLQVVGNCSVKNNNFAMRNRLQNDNLYKFIKNYEILALKSQLEINDKLIEAKEIQKDIQNLNSTFRGVVHPVIVEKELFRFFQKRADSLPKRMLNKPGDRIAEAILNAKDPVTVNDYFVESPKIFLALDKISTHFKSEKLKEVLNRFSTSYEVHTQRLKNTQIRRNLFDQFNEIPSVGRTNLLQLRDEKSSTDSIEVDSKPHPSSASSKKRKADKELPRNISGKRKVVTHTLTESAPIHH